MSTDKIIRLLTVFFFCSVDMDGRSGRIRTGCSVDELKKGILSVWITWKIEFKNKEQSESYHEFRDRGDWEILFRKMGV